jgi:RNA polymerase sigma-70 factor (ECF subfamily)
VLQTISDREHSELAERAVAGDRAALEELLVLHCDALSRWLESRLPRRARGTLSAEDLLQQTLFQAARGISALEGRSTAAVGAWLVTIANHRLQDSLEAHDCQKRGGRWLRTGEAQVDSGGSVREFVVLLSDDGPSPSGAVAQTEAVHAVQAGLALLPEDQRRAVLSRYFEGKSLAETAAAMHRTPGAVRGLIDRAKRSLREALGRSSRWFSKK